MSSDDLLDFYILVRGFVLLYGILVLIYEIQALANTEFVFPFDALKVVVGLSMVVFAVRPSIIKLFFRKT
ncbi:MAG: hypothetical protein QF812_02365 [Nitrososphaerales archaeon]|nr:hypothetical protein [Nitrososphaerales archaeon]HJN58140.1 hypothetical protein [Nitrososphaerales archaeon]